MIISGEAATANKSLFSNEQDADSKIIRSVICASQDEVYIIVVCSHDTDFWFNSFIIVNQSMERKYSCSLVIKAGMLI